ncbi:hypothetical protein [Anaerococcus cruorum]|uniref:Uncharacterized protein n=1 Tax=Anaerococcus cruorum TaxID=3115617 RepID=A0ABW9MW84_9FIRM
MNIYDSQEFISNIKTLDDEHLMSLRVWIDSKKNEKDKEDKILYIDLEIERRLKVRKYYANQI